MSVTTATSNSKLPMRIAAFDTLTEGLDYAAKGGTGLNFYSPRGEMTLVVRRQGAWAVVNDLAFGVVLLSLTVVISEWVRKRLRGAKAATLTALLSMALVVLLLASMVTRVSL